MSTDLRAGDLRLILVPEVGGAVARFVFDMEAGPIDLLRPMPAGATDAILAGMFPMVPFANCIRDNRLALADGPVTVAPNMPGTRLNFHGSGWQSKWRAERANSARVDLVLADGRVGKDWRYGALQRFVLDAGGLTVRTDLRNLGNRTMPFCFGQHPWFPMRDKVLVRFAAGGLWTLSAEGETVSHGPVPTVADHAQWREPIREARNMCYTGWDGRADLWWPSPGIGLSLTADAVFRHLMFHVPMSSEPVLCLEPQTNAPCAFDGLEDGLVRNGVWMLAPGEAVTGSIRFDLFRDLPTPGTSAA